MRWNQSYPKYPKCRTKDLAQWAVNANIYQFGAFTICIFMQFSNFINDPARRNFASVSISCSISLFAAISSALTLFHDWGGMCQDALGYVNPSRFNTKT